MKTNLIFALLSIFTLLTVAEAKQKPKYGVAGCGLGSEAFKENDTVQQVLAATTNGTSYNQTFGISSGTSNCTDDGTVNARHQVPMFIEANQVALATDIARGNGETLSNLSSVMGCSDTDLVSATLQRHYGQIFTTDNIKSAKVTGSIMDAVKSDSKLAHSCKNLI